MNYMHSKFDPEQSYTALYSFFDNSVDLDSEPEKPAPEDLVKKRDTHMEFIVPEEFRDDVRFMYLPSGRRDKSDPLGQKGYLGWSYKGTKNKILYAYGNVHAINGFYANLLFHHGVKLDYAGAIGSYITSGILTHVFLIDD